MTSRLSRSVAAGAAAVMVAAGLSVSTGAAVASADTSQCGLAQTATYRGLDTLGTNYYLSKEVLGDGTAAPGGTVTFQTTVTGAGALVRRIDDIHPEGFQLTKARSSVWYLLGGQQWEDVTDEVKKDAASNSVWHSGAGWTTAGDAHATFETTYRVPADATPGDVLNTGAATTLSLANGRKVEDPFDVCVTIREPNPVEAVSGSLEGLGLGALSSGSSGVGDSATNPAGFIADVVNGIDFGKIIGAAAGS